MWSFDQIIRANQGHMRFQYRVCHNHLKQPWKKGEPLHHQGTCYLSIFRGPIFPCNKVVMVDPVIEPWFVDAWNVQTQLASTTRTDLTFKSWIQLGTDLVATKYNKLELQEGEKHSLYILWFNGCTISNRSYHVISGAYESRVFFKHSMTNTWTPFDAEETNHP